MLSTGGQDFSLVAKLVTGCQSASPDLLLVRSTFADAIGIPRGPINKPIHHNCGGSAVTYGYGGDVDGPAHQARFDWGAIALDTSGNLYMSGEGNIRKGGPTSSLPPVVLGSPFLSDGKLGFWISGLPGSTVAVESSSDLNNWQLVGMYRLDGGSNLFVNPTPSARSKAHLVVHPT